MDYLIAPSILAADFSKLGEEVESVMQAGADLIHFDVMDGHYVPALTVGPVVLEALCRRIPNLIVDVHLMVNHESDRLVGDFIDAGASYISIHPDSTEDPESLLKTIRHSHVKAGIVLNPNDEIELISTYLPYIDYLLIMSVYPGKGGQAFIQESLNRVQRAQQIIRRSAQDIQIEIDGGISPSNIKACAEAGASMFVAGSSVFGNASRQEAMNALRDELSSATPHSMDEPIRPFA